jgi:hypothetical protein
MTDRELMQQALEALGEIEWSNNSQWQSDRAKAAITALRHALETEPFEYWTAVEGWVKIDEVREHFDSVGCGTIYKSAGEGRLPLYTAPPKQWVGLTEREVELIDEMIETQLLHAERCDHMANSTMAQKQKAWDLERVELLRKLKEKNA